MEKNKILYIFMDCSFLQINIKDFLIYIFSKEFIAYYKVKCLNLYIKCRKKLFINIDKLY